MAGGHQKGAPKTGGRVEGTPNKITTDLREAIMHAFDTVGGEAYLVTVAKKNPQVFCALLARILPVQVTAAKDGVDPTAKIAEALELLRNRLGPPPPALIEHERREQAN